MYSLGRMISLIKLQVRSRRSIMSTLFLRGFTPLVTCLKCEHPESYYGQLQIRSADEPMTTCERLGVFYLLFANYELFLVYKCDGFPSCNATSSDFFLLDAQTQHADIDGERTSQDVLRGYQPLCLSKSKIRKEAVLPDGDGDGATSPSLVATIALSKHVSLVVLKREYQSLETVNAIAKSGVE
jgi:hypothetical protein